MKRIFIIFFFSFFVFHFSSVFAQISSGKTYRIASFYAAGKSLTTTNSSLDAKADVITWTETNVDAQRWTAVASGDNFFYLANAYSGLVMSESSHRPKAGDKIIQDVNDNTYCKWEFLPVANGAYPNAYFIRFSIQSSDNYLYLEPDTDANASAIKLQLKKTDADSIRQMWFVESTPNFPIGMSEALRDSVMLGWKNRYFNMLKTSTGFWGEAEMMETILDAYETTGKQEYKTMFEQVYEHFVSYPAGWEQPGNGQDWTWNEYNDDIAWAVLASIRAYLMFGQHPNSGINYLTIAKNNYDNMYSRALLPSGMLRWKQTPTGNQGSNSCINGPAEVAACYLAMATGDDSYYEKAKKLYALQRQYLYDPATGKVYDSGSWNNGVFTVGNYWVSSYNQGTFLGAALMLFNHYGTAQYRTDANKIAEWTRNDLCNTHGVIKVCGSGDDLQGFKGILMRYLRRYVVDLALPDKVEWLQQNALQAFNNRNSKGVIWTAWWEKTSENFIFSDGYDFSNKPFGCSTAVSAAFNAPLDKNLIVKDAFSTIEAENFDYLKGVFVEKSSRNPTCIGNIQDNYYTAYNNVDFGNGTATSIVIRVYGASGGSIELHDGSVSGQLLATVNVPAGNSWTDLSTSVSLTGQHNIYFVFKGNGFKMDKFSFNSEGNGLKNPSEKSIISLYPNPATTVLHVDFPQNGYASIYNSSGKEVAFANIFAGKTTLNVKDYQSGVYFINISTSNESFFAKFLKK